MKKTILTFGLISGAVSTLMMWVSMLFADKIGFDRGYVVGYTSIVLSFLLVYFGIRSYRDNIGNGQITFAKGFTVGICILYFNFMPDFMDKYGAHVVEKLKAAGATAATIQAKVQELEKLKAMYKNPLFNAAMTFVEPFPVGLVITLLIVAPWYSTSSLVRSDSPRSRSRTTRRS